jgi:hypothetical protein
LGKKQAARHPDLAIQIRVFFTSSSHRRWIEQTMILDSPWGETYIHNGLRFISAWKPRVPSLSAAMEPSTKVDSLCIPLILRKGYGVGHKLSDSPRSIPSSGSREGGMATNMMEYINIISLNLAGVNFETGRALHESLTGASEPPRPRSDSSIGQIPHDCPLLRSPQSTLGCFSS